MDPTLRLALKFAYWIVVYFVFVPMAKIKNRSKVGWFLIGLASFPLPLIGLLLIGNIAGSSAREHGQELPWIFHHASDIGIFFGIIGFIGARILLRKLPPL